MKHKKIEKIILNIFRLMPLLCLLLFILYICLTGFTKVKANTYANTNTEHPTEETTIYTYSLDTISYSNDVYLTNSNFLDYSSNSNFVLMNTSNYDNLFIGSYDFYDGGGILPKYVYGYYTYAAGGGWIFSTDGVYFSDVNDIRNNLFPDGELTYNDIISNFGRSNLQVLKNDIFYIVDSGSYTDNFTIVNKVKYYFNDYIFKYTDSLFNGSINTPFNAFANAINLSNESIFYTYVKFSYLYLLYIFLIDILYLLYNIIVFIPKWLITEFEKRT